MVPNAVVRVQTRAELELFTEFCDAHGLCWRSGGRFSSGSRWNNYEDQTCYFIEHNKITYSFLQFAENGYLKSDEYEEGRPVDPRLLLCSVETLISIVEGREFENDDVVVSAIDGLL